MSDLAPRAKSSPTAFVETHLGALRLWILTALVVRLWGWLPYVAENLGDPLPDPVSASLWAALAVLPTAYLCLAAWHRAPSAPVPVWIVAIVLSFVTDLVLLASGGIVAFLNIGVVVSLPILWACNIALLVQLARPEVRYALGPGRA